MGSNLAIKHTGEPWFVDGKGLDKSLQRWGHGTDVWLLHCGSWDTDKHCYRHLDMDVIGLGPYLQELSRCTGLTSLSLLPVLILLWTLDS